MSRARRPIAIVLLAMLVTASGCFMVGPDYEPPEAPVAEEWLAPEWKGAESGADLGAWWRTFRDPALDRLIELAYAQNLSLEVAGLRVIEAQARRGLAIASLFPQRQEAFGAYTRQRLSQNTAQATPFLDPEFDNWSVSALDAAWEIDLWGKFRRGIESADASLLGSVFNFEDVLVSLIGEVAATYVDLRTFDEQLAVARRNRDVQQRSLTIAETRFEFGAVTELDVAQSRSQLRDTEATIPALEALRRQSANTLSVLLGLPPQDLAEILEEGTIPSAEEDILIGIPAELLRRRPDIRRAERDIAAQSAQIGVAAADLYPSFQLVGSIGFEAEDIASLFEGNSFSAFGGPQFRWNILNYGRIRNNIRVQDALFQQLVVSYENTVLGAQREAEDAMARYLGALRRVAFLEDAAKSARRAVDLANLQYQEGAVDYNTVLNTQQFLLQAEDRLVSTRGDVALSLVALYRALGGGWEIRMGNDFIRDGTRSEMEERTNWGDLLDPADQAEQIEGADTGTESDRTWWRWRWWWPQW